MVKFSGTLANFFESGSSAFPNATGSSGYTARLFTSNTFVPTKFQGTLANFFESGSSAFPNATGSGGYTARLVTSNTFVPTKFQGTLYNPFISGSEASSQNVTGFTSSFGAGGNRIEPLIGGYVATRIQSDLDPPFVTSSNPASGALNVARDRTVQFLFDDLFTGSVNFFGGSGGVIRESVHVQFQFGAPNVSPMIPVIVSGVFASGFNGGQSTFVPSGTQDNKGIFNGFFITIQRTSQLPAATDIQVNITGADAYGNIFRTTYPFRTQAGCPELIGTFTSTDYTITDGAQSLREHTFNNAECNFQQAPYNMMIPGTLRLRTFGQTAYTNVKSGQSFNQKSETLFPVGKNSP